VKSSRPTDAEPPRDARTYDPVPVEPPFSDFFEPLRQSRRDARLAPGSEPQRSAIVTMVHNEPAFLPIWLRYYSRFFEPRDIYVLDNDTTDGSTEGGGFVRIPAHHDRVDHEWMVGRIQELQHELLGDYDVVVVTDVDEIVAPHPSWGTLGDYLAGFAEPWVNCRGYEIVHLPDREPPLRLDRPVMKQRGFWFGSGFYNKPAIATVPMTWEPGFHGRADGDVALDPDLYLIHLHRVDYGLCLERHRVRESRAWRSEDLDSSWAAHNRITGDEAFDRWFFSETGFEPLVHLRLEPIPREWRKAF
jgi:hypothetical protein